MPIAAAIILTIGAPIVCWRDIERLTIHLGRISSGIGNLVNSN